MAKKPVKTQVKKDVIPQEILVKLKRVKAKYFKDDTLTEVREIYLNLYKEDKEEHKDKKWNNMIHHKRTLTKLKNKKKSEKLGGAVDKYYGVILASSRIRDLSEKRRNKIIEIYAEDPQKAINEELIVIRKSTNPATGEIEKVPVLDDAGGVIPRDNVEFFKRKSGTNFKNPNHGQAIARAYRKNVIGVLSSSQGIKGIFIHELRDKSVDLDIPMNVLVKFSGKTLGSELITLDENKYIDEELLEEMIDNLETDIEQGIITEEFAENMKEHYTKLLLLNDEGEARTRIETNFFKLRSTKGTAFIRVENEKEFETVDFPMKDNMQLDINLIYKQYFYIFTSDCSNLLQFHSDHRYIDGDKEEINWNEIVCLQDVNLIQINMEASMGGNYTLHIEDESLFNRDTEHLGEDIDTIKILVPSYMNLNFAQDSKLNVIGSPVQFQAQDNEREDLWDTEIIINDEGIEKEIKVPIMGYPLIMVHGIYPIPEYIEEVETVDLTLDDEIDVNELLEKKPKSTKLKLKTEDAIEKLEDAIEDIEEIEEDIEEEIKDAKVIPSKKESLTKTTPSKKPKIPTKPEEIIEDEDEVEDDSLW